MEGHLRAPLQWPTAITPASLSATLRFNQYRRPVEVYWPLRYEGFGALKPFVLAARFLARPTRRLDTGYECAQRH